MINKRKSILLLFLSVFSHIEFIVLLEALLTRVSVSIFHTDVIIEAIILFCLKAHLARLHPVVWTDFSVPVSSEDGDVF